MDDAMREAYADFRAQARRNLAGEGQVQHQVDVQEPISQPEGQQLEPLVQEPLVSKPKEHKKQSSKQQEKQILLPAPSIRKRLPLPVPRFPLLSLVRGDTGFGDTHAVDPRCEHEVKHAEPTTPEHAEAVKMLQIAQKRQASKNMQKEMQKASCAILESAIKEGLRIKFECIQALSGDANKEKRQRIAKESVVRVNPTAVIVWNCAKRQTLLTLEHLIAPKPLAHSPGSNTGGVNNFMQDPTLPEAPTAKHYAIKQDEGEPFRDQHTHEDGQLSPYARGHCANRGNAQMAIQPWSEPYLRRLLRKYDCEGPMELDKSPAEESGDKRPCGKHLHNKIAQSTFVYSNCFPQSAPMNSLPWTGVEGRRRGWTETHDHVLCFTLPMFLQLQDVPERLVHQRAYFNQPDGTPCPSFGADLDKAAGTHRRAIYSPRVPPEAMLEIPTHVGAITIFGPSKVRNSGSATDTAKALKNRGNIGPIWDKPYELKPGLWQADYFCMPNTTHPVYEASMKYTLPLSEMELLVAACGIKLPGLELCMGPLPNQRGQLHAIVKPEDRRKWREYATSLTDAQPQCAITFAALGLTQPPPTSKQRKRRATMKFGQGHNRPESANPPLRYDETGLPERSMLVRLLSWCVLFDKLLQ